MAIGALFAIAGMTIGTWTARIPAVQHRLDLSDSELSIALLALALGGLIGMRSAGRFVDHYGTVRVMTVPALTLGSALTAAAYAPNLPTLGAALLLLGMLHGTLNVGMNAAAVACQIEYRRPIMTSFHALFSIGGVAGAAISAACTHAELSVGQTFIAVGAAMTVTAAWGIRRLIPSTADADATSSQKDVYALSDFPSRARRPVVLLGLLAFCSLLSEGAAADWSSVFLDRLGSAPAYAAAAYAAFAGCMTLGRLAGDRITAVVAPVALMRGSGLIALTGMAIGIMVGNPTAAIAGFACLGLGLSCVIPQLYTAAGNLNPDRPGAVLSRVAAVGYLGYLIGPVLIGAVATDLGLSHALLILPALATLLVLAAPVVRPTPRARRTTTGQSVEPAMEASA